MASKELSSKSKIPKFRSSAPSSPRVPSATGQRSVLEKSKSNLSSSSRIPQVSKLNFRKRQTTAIPSQTIPAPASKIKVPQALQRQGSKIPTIGRNLGAIHHLPKQQLKSSSQVTPTMDESSGKSQGDTPLLNKTEPMIPIKKKPQLEVTHHDHIVILQESCSTSSLKVFETAELDLALTEPVEPTSDVVLKAEQFFDDIAQFAAPLSQPPSPAVEKNDQPSPYAYGESFQLSKFSEDPVDQDIPENEIPVQDVFETNTEEDSESDYGFFYEDEDDEVGEMEEDCASEGDQGDTSVLQLSGTLQLSIPSKVNDGGARKMKTIFSVDAPTADAQKENGPGVNGDGYEAPRRPPSNKEIEVLFHKDRKVVVEDVDTDIEDEEGMQEEWPEVTEKSSRLNAVNGYIEILPKMGSNSTVKQTCSSTKSENAKTFSLILQRSSVKIGREFEKSLEINNMTPDLHGFKVWCNSCAYSHLDITPSLGFIKPGQQVSVEISTKNPRVHTLNYDMEKNRIAVKIFPAYCSDLDSLKDYYQKLEEQRPDLISIQPVQRMILWDSGNISGRLELFKSIDNEEELESLKEELHNMQLGQYPSETMLSLSSSQTAIASLLEYLKDQLIYAQYSLHENVQLIASVRNVQQAGFLMLVFFIMGSLLFPSIFRKDLGPLSDVNKVVQKSAKRFLWTRWLELKILKWLK